MTCKDCIHNEVCHMRKVCDDIEEQIKESGCMDFIARTAAQKQTEVTTMRDIEFRGKHTDSGLWVY